MGAMRTFGERFREESIVNEFFKHCSVNQFNYQDLWRELERSREEIEEQIGERGVRLIEERIEDLDECPNCNNTLLYNAVEDEKYCSVCPDMIDE